MNQKRLTGIFCLLLAAFSLFFFDVSAAKEAHKEHSACKAIHTQADLMQMQSGECGYLAEDIALSETVSIDGKITLCLNGKVLRYEKEDGSIFCIGKEGALVIFDCAEETRSYRAQENGLWTLGDGEEHLKGGVILGGKGEKCVIGELENTYVCGGFACIDGGTLSLYGGNIIGNQAEYGAAVYITGGGRFEMYGGKIGGNLASSRGGGVFVYSGEMLLEKGSVSQNRSEKNGGGIDISGEGILEMRGGFVTGNTAGAWSGGIENFGIFEMYGGTVSENSAVEDAGGVYNGGVFTMRGGSIRENSAKYGGGVCNDSKMTLHDGTVCYNLAQESGGGIYNADTLVINGGTVSSNTAVTSGGGIENDGVCTMYGGTVGGKAAADANMAYLGGGVSVYSGTFIMYGGSIERNTAVDGGGVENESVFSMQGGTVAYNYAALQGGGVTNRGRLLLGGEATVISNASGAGENEHAGGGIYWIVEESTFVSVSDSVRVTKNTTNGKNANLVVYGKGEIFVSGAEASMHIGLTLLDSDKETASGTAARFARAEDAVKADTVFVSDSESFGIHVQEDTVNLAKKGGGVWIPVALLAVLVTGIGIAVFAVTQRKNAGKRKKNG